MREGTTPSGGPTSTGAGPGSIVPARMPMTASIHPDYADQKLVPEWAVPGNMTAAQSLLALLAGAFIGAAVGNIFSRSPSTHIVMAAAQECVTTKDASACSELTLTNSTNWPVLLTGIVLFAIYALSMYRRRKAK
jgi:hypothetical protein